MVSGSRTKSAKVRNSRSGGGRSASAPAVRVQRTSRPPLDVLREWDRLVGRSIGSDVTQLSCWATIRAQADFEPVFLLAYRDSALVGGALLLRRTLIGVLPVGYVSYGPVVDAGVAARGEVVSALTAELATVARSLALTFIQPPEGADDVSVALLAEGFRVSHAGIAPAGSYRVDLTPPVEVIRAGMSKRLKSWTNRWAAKGVTVRLGDENDLLLLSQLMVHTGDVQGFAPPPLQHLQLLYHELRAGGHAALFIGEVDGRPVCADLVSMMGDTVRGRRCGFDRSGEAGKRSVPAAVRWEIIKWGKAHGYRWLDFGGLPEGMLDDMLVRGIRTSDAWPTAHRAKLAFNGIPFRYPCAVELIRPAPIRLIYDIATRWQVGRRVIGIAKDGLQSPAQLAAHPRGCA